jgi:hypothetical protein
LLIIFAKAKAISQHSFKLSFASVTHCCKSLAQGLVVVIHTLNMSQQVCKTWVNEELPYIPAGWLIKPDAVTQKKLPGVQLSALAKSCTQ